MTSTASGIQAAGLSAIMCADWGKENRKRALYVADIASRIVERVSGQDWSVATVLGEAERRAAKGSVLVTFDAPLGVPESYLAAAAGVQSWRVPKTFLDLLACACSTPAFFDASSTPDDWKIERPFFKVPAGEGGLKSYQTAAARIGIDLYRTIDKRTKAKTVFAKSEIPGSVGSAACDLWKEIGARLTESRTFRVWPFEDDLEFLIRSAPIVIGEIYPRAAYAISLLPMPSAERPRLAVAKTKRQVRVCAMEQLLSAEWVGALGVSIKDSQRAESNEDDFDSCITAAALLRCVLEDDQLCPAVLSYADAEGGILGTSAINLQLPEQCFPPTRSNGISRRPVENRGTDRTYRCPIEGCKKVYRGTRGGWDGHVGSARIHPCWHPEITSNEARKRQFEMEFPDFFK
jgi:hypothetical protein